MSTLYRDIGELDSAKYYAKSVIKSWNDVSEMKNLLEAVDNLGQVYKLTRGKDSAIKYIEQFHALQDSIFSEENRRKVQNISFNENARKQELIDAQVNYNNRLQKIALIGGLLALLLVAGLLWRNNLHKQKSYTILEKQKKETEVQKILAEQTLGKLKATQSQLIHSEKMASLGELTAGIAHEIQNPLNFVNNFSEVNTELIGEMKKEMNAGNTRAAYNIADDLEANMGKITSHGKRADAIVKSMLAHSLNSSGKAESTNINAFAVEYFRLSYHGFNAKNKAFHAEMHTDIDHNIGNMDIVPQDIGRVLLNLFNNAFYAVWMKMKTAGIEFKPLVTLTTRLKKSGTSTEDHQNSQSAIRNAQSIVITIEDNGTGIKEETKKKIFQPFFTTKPTGEGTGLGLSLSYDIIKAHGGEIFVETREGEGSTFIIQLPGI
jgi:two-component system, NtrC family, sensor kinase